MQIKPVKSQALNRKLQNVAHRSNEVLRDAFGKNWIAMAALSSAILAVCAALTGVGSTSHGNAVTRDLIRNANEWNHFQAKGIKANLLQTRIEILTLMNREVPVHDRNKVDEYKIEQETISDKAKGQEESIAYHLKISGLFSRGVMFFQIAIGVIAVSLLTKKKSFWFVGMGLGTYGLFYAIQGLLV